MTVQLFSVLPAPTLAAIRPIPTVLAILAGISAHALPAMAPKISLPVSSDIFISAVANSALVLPMVSSSARIASASMPFSLAPTVNRQYSPEPTIINH